MSERMGDALCQACREGFGAVYVLLECTCAAECRYFINADVLISAVKTESLYGKYRHYYFRPLSFFIVSSSSAYLKATSSLKTESAFSSSFLWAWRFISSVALA